MLPALLTSLLAALPAPAAPTYASGLQAAIDSTPNGGTVEVRPGVYGELIRIKGRQGLKIIARGGPALVLHQAIDWTGWQSGVHPLPLLQIEDSSDIRLVNLYFRRDVQRKRDPYRAVTALVTGSKRIHFEHVYLGSDDGKALEVGNSEVSLADCTLEALQYGIAEGGSTLTVTGSSVVAQQVPVAAFTQGCQSKGLAISRSLLSGRVGLALCEADYAKLRGNVIAGTFWKWQELPPSVAEAKRHNVLVDPEAPTPEIEGVSLWRPDPALLSNPLQAFAVLPPPSPTDPAPGSEWFLCSKTGRTDWRLFPDGPSTAHTLPIPLPLPSCGALFEAPSEATPVRVLERRGEWLSLRPDRAYIETGPHRVEQGFWVRADSVSTPCVLASGGSRAWTRLWSGKVEEAIDERRVALRGTVDYCGSTTQTLTVEVPPSLRPAIQRAFTLECTLKPNPRHCPR